MNFTTPVLTLILTFMREISKILFCYHTSLKDNLAMLETLFTSNIRPNVKRIIKSSSHEHLLRLNYLNYSYIF